MQLTDENIIEAKIRLLRLTAIILREGVTESSRQILDDIPSLSVPETSGEYPSATGRFSVLDRDVAYRHSAYVDRELRAELDRQLVVAFATSGLITGTSVPTDHISNYLEHLARLLTRHSSQGENDYNEFAMAYVVPWIFPLSQSVKRFDGGVASVLLLTVLEMLVSSISPERSIEFADSAEPDLLADGTASVRNIATHLSRPEKCGMFVGRDSIVDVGRRIGIPAGFGSRRDMCMVLLESAERYGNLQELAGSFIGVFDEEKQFYEMIQGGNWDSLKNLWLRRVVSTIDLLRVVQTGG